MSQGILGSFFADWIATLSGQIGVGWQEQLFAAYAVRLIKDL